MFVVFEKVQERGTTLLAGVSSLALWGRTGDATSVAVDTSACWKLTWHFYGKRGPEKPDLVDNLRLSYFNDQSNWIEVDAWSGGPAADPYFVRRAGTITADDAMHAGLQVRLQSDGCTGNCDHYFIDEFELFCGTN